MAGRDITESSGYYDLSVDIGIVSSNALWSNTDVAYDVAVGGLPFIYAINDARPYLRQTAPFRKDQFDNGTEPGEQSLSGWWLRSQSSFHGGAGINFFDPLTNDENGHYRFNDSRGVNVWTKGQVNLLKDVVSTHETTGTVTGSDHQHPNQHVRSIQWSGTEGVLLHDEYDVDKIAADGTVTHFIDYLTGGAEPVRAICDDGVYAYWVANATDSGANKLHMYKKLLTDNTSTIPSPMFTETGLVIQYATMEYIKDRIILCVNNKVYELATTATALPTPVYTNSNANYHYTSIAASGPAIYTAGHSGIYSTIQKYTLGTNGTMPTLSQAVVAAELPAGEIIEKIFYYLGYMMIGTSKGIRVADINDQDGSLKYGPLIVETSQPVYDFTARDKFVWAATGIGALDGGLIRMDLGTELEPLRFAYANDLQVTQSTEHYTTAVAFVGVTNRLAFTTAHKTTDGAIYLESASTLVPTGYLQTGKVRYSTLEPKNFKRLLARGNFDNGSFTLATVVKDGTATGKIYDHITYESGVSPVEVGTTQPETPQEYVSFKFTFNRDADVTSTGPIFEGWQAKATIATPRQRVMQFPVYCFDVETDRFNSVVGFEGRADERLRALEAIEENGDVVVWQDLSTGESRQCVIEQVTYSRMTPPDKRFDGQGGVIEIRIRTV